MTEQMSDNLKNEIAIGMKVIQRRCETVLTHIAKDRHKSVIWDSLKWVKKDIDHLLKFAKEEYRKECYGIRKESEE